MYVCIQKYMRYLSVMRHKKYFNMKGENSINRQCCKLPLFFFFFFYSKCLDPTFKKKKKVKTAK